MFELGAPRPVSHRPQRVKVATVDGDVGCCGVHDRREEADQARVLPECTREVHGLDEHVVTSLHGLLLILVLWTFPFAICSYGGIWIPTLSSLVPAVVLHVFSRTSYRAVQCGRFLILIGLPSARTSRATAIESNLQPWNAAKLVFIVSLALR